MLLELTGGSLEELKKLKRQLKSKYYAKSGEGNPLDKKKISVLDHLIKKAISDSKKERKRDREMLSDRTSPDTSPASVIKTLPTKPSPTATTEAPPTNTEEDAPTPPKTPPIKPLTVKTFSIKPVFTTAPSSPNKTCSPSYTQGHPLLPSPYDQHMTTPPPIGYIPYAGHSPPVATPQMGMSYTGHSPATPPPVGHSPPVVTPPIGYLSYSPPAYYNIPPHPLVGSPPIIGTSPLMPAGAIPSRQFMPQPQRPMSIPPANQGLVPRSMPANPGLLPSPGHGLFPNSSHHSLIPCPQQLPYVRQGYTTPPTTPPLYTHYPPHR